jgi:monoamine oxidase
MPSSIPETTQSAPLTVLIIGGGLSGLTVAHELTRLQSTTAAGSSSSSSSLTWHLVESQNYLGGRIKNDEATNRIDMGGAWIWPSQHKIHSLVKDLKLGTIVQRDAEDGRVRICNGAARIIDGLAARLNGECVTLSTAAISVERMNHVVKVVLLQQSTETNVHQQQCTVYTKHLVWTAPPQMTLAPYIHWNPPLSDSKIMAMKQCNTWMASVTKLSFIYDRKYWDVQWIMEMKRGIYFYGDAEAFDIYDACIEDCSDNHADKKEEEGNDGNIYAFTLFALVNWDQQESSTPTNDDGIANRIMGQLHSIASSSRMISQSSTTSKWMTQYNSYSIQHWPQVSSISHEAHPTSVGSHPRPNPVLSESEWKSSPNDSNGEERRGCMVHFAGTESDLYSPGLMEGAVGSAFRVVEEMKRYLE